MLPDTNTREILDVPFGREIVKLLRNHGGSIWLFRFIAGMCLAGIGDQVVHALDTVLGTRLASMDYAERWCAAHVLLTAVKATTCPVALAVDPDDGRLYVVLLDR